MGLGGIQENEKWLNLYFCFPFSDFTKLIKEVRAWNFTADQTRELPGWKISNEQVPHRA